MKKVLFLLLALVVVATALPVALLSDDAAEAQPSPSIQMAMVLDGSGSISSGEWSTIINGLANATANESCLPQDGSVELTVIQFSDYARLEVGPVVVTQANVAEVTTNISSIAQINGMTCIACGINLAANVLYGHPDANFDAGIKQAINVVTDGAPNECSDATQCTEWQCPATSCSGTTASNSSVDARDYAIGLLQMTEDQDEIDAEGIGVSTSAKDWLRDAIVYPQPGYEDWPPSGPGWVRVVADASEFAATICEKFDIVVKGREVPVDIKPTSCRNPLNVGSKGMLPVAILGTMDNDVTQIDPASVQLGNVSPLLWAYEDVATPFEPYMGKVDAFDCTTEGPDGYLDLTLKFDTQAVVADLGALEDGDVMVLQLTGNRSGTAIMGEDVVVILKKGK